VSGVAVIRYLLANNAPLLAFVPATRIVAGGLALIQAMPAIEVRQIDSVLPFNQVFTNSAPRVFDDRVQVAVVVKGPAATPPGLGYPQLRSLLRLVLAACPSQRGIVNGINVESIRPDLEGPDLPPGDVDFYSGSRDFLVRWTA